MAARIQRNRRGSTPPAPAANDNSRVKVETFWVDINDIQPYEFNARHNQEAIAAVAESIKQFGFIQPVVIDDNGVLAAGHTRTEAAKLLGLAEVLAIRASHLRPEQIAAFRLVDNKVGEIATWDNELLANEIRTLEGMFDFSTMGWDQTELDCLGQLVAEDCLSTGGIVPQETADRAATTTRRAPTQTRIVIGDFVMFRPSSSVRNFLDGLRRAHDSNSESMATDIADRLGILD